MKNKKIIRKNFRESVLRRDVYKCRVCGRNDVKLDIHQITDRTLMTSQGYCIENGITLCDTENGCHIKAEKYHISGGEIFINGFHPNDLYKLINSSYEIACKKSKEL